jgi:protein phosphatase
LRTRERREWHGTYAFEHPAKPALAVLQFSYGCVRMLEAFALSDKGCVRANNEDYCLIDADRGLYVLADGMGGAKAGEQASRMAVETVAETVRSSSDRDSQVLIRAAVEANRRVLEAAHNDPALEGMGTTLVAALDLDTEMAIASVGDSRAYVMDGQGLKVITDDQTWVNEVGRPLGLDEDSLRHHPMRHVLTMAIGASAPLAINHYKIPLATGTMVLICSDGLHGVLETPQMEQILETGRSQSLEDNCRKLIQAAKDAGGPDNVTAVLMRKTG